MAMCIDVLLLLLVLTTPTRACTGQDGCLDSKSVSSSSSSSYESESTNSTSSTFSSHSAEGPQYSYSYSSSNSTESAYENSFRSNFSSSYETNFEFSSNTVETESFEPAVSHGVEAALDEDDVPSSPPESAPLLLSPVASAEPHQQSVETPETLPSEFYPCGYPKPVDPSQPETSDVQYYATPKGGPCPSTYSAKKSEAAETTAPAPFPSEKQKRESVIQEDAQQQPAAVEDTQTESTKQPTIAPTSKPVVVPTPHIKRRNSEVTAKRVKDLLDSKNVTGLAALVVESDDIYGLTMGFTFDDEEREEEIQRTVIRQSDKDVVALKALATAALTPEAKLKVIEIMVLTATSPGLSLRKLRSIIVWLDGYHYNQHRPLVEQFVEIFYDDALLLQVIASDAQTYARRRLLCVGCTPVNSYVCAHCWPTAICKAYFWCSASGQRAVAKPTSPKRKAKASENENAQSRDAASSKASKSKRHKRRSRRRRRNRRQTRRAHSHKSSPP